MEIGAVIKEYRMLKNMTQEELAEALSVTSQAVSRWETGVSYPDIAMIPNIVKVLDVSADKLLGCDKWDGKKRPKQPMKKGDILNQDQINCIFGYTPLSHRQPKTVLIVDDSDFMRMMLEDILSRDHHKILQAKSGEECLEKLQTEKVDVCVLDIMMPGIDGLETLKRVKERCQEVKVIMLSALCSEETVKKALEFGADSFVAKPFQASRISERI